MEVVFIGIAYSLAVLIVSIFLTVPFSGWLARLVGAIDLQGDIKVHTEPTPRLGGLGILLAFFLGLGGLCLTIEIPNSEYRQLVLILALLTPLAICGYFDDVRNLSAFLRFLVQGIISFIFVAIVGANLNWFVLVICWFWIVGLVNAYNFLDGLDGLAGGIAVVNLIALAIMLLLSGNGLLAIVSGTMALATCGFLRYNLPPASIFMGDIGSLSLGFIVAALSLMLVVNENFSINSQLAVILAASLPLGDLVATVFRRLLSGKSIFQGDRGHFYDVMVYRLNLSQDKVTYCSISISIILASLSLVVFRLSF